MGSDSLWYVLIYPLAQLNTTFLIKILIYFIKIRSALVIYIYYLGIYIYIPYIAGYQGLGGFVKLAKYKERLGSSQ